jgi:hypothetical protein
VDHSCSRAASVVLGEYLLTVGRLPECTITLGDPNVSRRHAEIRPSGSGLPAHRPRVPNGTLVNGQRVHEHQLVDGDVITFSATAITFVEPDARRAAAGDDAAADSPDGTVMSARPCPNRSSPSRLCLLAFLPVLPARARCGPRSVHRARWLSQRHPGGRSCTSPGRGTVTTWPQMRIVEPRLSRVASSISARAHHRSPPGVRSRSTTPSSHRCMPRVPSGRAVPGRGPRLPGSYLNRQKVTVRW